MVAEEEVQVSTPVTFEEAVQKATGTHKLRTIEFKSIKARNS